MSETKKNKWVVCFSGYWNDSSIYAIGQIMLKYKEDGHSILWINSIPNRGVFGGKGKSGGNKLGTLKRYWFKLSAMLTPLRKKEENFYIFTPVFLPWLENKNIVYINDLLVKVQLKIIFLFLNIKDYILASSSMMNTPFYFKDKKYKYYFHYAADLYSDYRDASTFIKEKMLKREDEIFNFTDKIFAVSQAILTKLSKRIKDKEKIIYLPHGVDFEHFNKKRTISTVMTAIKSPIVGYFGSLTNTNDKDAVLKLAQNGFSVVLIGHVGGDYEECRKNTNIHLLGQIPYMDLPAYAQGFDVCLLNWVMAEWIKNCNPKKTYEYLAMGKPIVSCRIPEIEYRLGNLIYYADTPEDYVISAKKALAENSADKIIERIEIAKKEDWGYKYLIVKSTFNKN
jgi:hypothetical protein